MILSGDFFSPTNFPHSHDPFRKEADELYDPTRHCPIRGGISSISCRQFYSTVRTVDDHVLASLNSLRS